MLPRRSSHPSRARASQGHASLGTHSKPRTLPETVRRRKILDAARFVLVRNGYGDVSLDAVARRADVAKGTLYLYFKDKEDLLAAVLGDLTERLEEKLERIPACDGTTESLRRLAEVHLDFMDRYRDFVSQLMPSRHMLRSSAGRAIHERLEGHIDTVARRWIRPCIAQGVLREHDEHLGSMFFLSMNRLFMDRKFVRGDKKPLKRGARQLVTMFMNGLGAPRRHGRKSSR